MSEEETVEESTEDQTTDIALPDVSDEDLASLLSEAMEGLSENGSDQSSEESTEDDQSTETTQESQETQADGQKQKEPQPPVTEQMLKQELDKKNQQLAQQEQFIQRRNNEIGELRKEKSQLIGQIEQLKEQAREDGNMEQLLELREQEKKARDEDAQLEQEQQQNLYVHNAQKAVAQHLSADEANLDGIGEMLINMGADRARIEQFKQNPYSVLSPDAIIFGGKLQHREKLLVQVVQVAKNLKARVKELEGKPQSVVEKIAKTAKQKPKLKSSAGANTGKQDVNPALLSDDDLDKLLQNAG